MKVGDLVTINQCEHVGMILRSWDMCVMHGIYWVVLLTNGIEVVSHYEEMDVLP